MDNSTAISLCFLALVGAITAARIVKVEQLLAILSESQGPAEVDTGVQLDASPYQQYLSDLDIDLDLSDLLQGCSHGRCEYCTTEIVKACIVAEVLSSGVGFEITLTINGQTVFHNQVTVANPPPFCVKKIGDTISDLCLTVYDINLKELSACAKLSFTIKTRWIKKKVSFKIGCFKIPTAETTWDDAVTDNISGNDGDVSALLYKPAGAI